MGSDTSLRILMAGNSKEFDFKYREEKKVRWSCLRIHGMQESYIFFLLLSSKMILFSAAAAVVTQ